MSNYREQAETALQSYKVSLLPEVFATAVGDFSRALEFAPQIGQGYEEVVGSAEAIVNVAIAKHGQDAVYWRHLERLGGFIPGDSLEAIQTQLKKYSIGEADGGDGEFIDEYRYLVVPTELSPRVVSLYKEMNYA